MTWICDTDGSRFSSSTVNFIGLSEPGGALPAAGLATNTAAAPAIPIPVIIRRRDNGTDSPMFRSARSRAIRRRACTSSIGCGARSHHVTSQTLHLVTEATQLTVRWSIAFFVQVHCRFCTFAATARLRALATRGPHAMLQEVL